jgi:hypothetical protein
MARLMISLMILITVAILMVGFFYLIDKTCYFGHSWYLEQGSLIRQPNGAKRLPGDYVTDDYLRPHEEVGYRWERHCLKCNKIEYGMDFDSKGKRVWGNVPKN